MCRNHVFDELDNAFSSRFVIGLDVVSIDGGDVGHVVEACGVADKGDAVAVDYVDFKEFVAVGGVDVSGYESVGREMQTRRVVDR